jgi:hypothetical protein
MNWKVQQAYRYINQKKKKSKHFTMFYINLKQDLKKYVQPNISMMADLFTLAPAPPPPSRQYTEA